MLASQTSHDRIAETGPFDNVKRGEVCFRASGTWVVPAGVTSISAVLIGAGGGGIRRATATQTANGGFGGAGSGGLCYINNLPVTPGETLTVTVGAGGRSGVHLGTATTVPTDGGQTQILRGTNVLVSAHGGRAGFFGATVAHTVRPGTQTPAGAGPFGGTVGGGLGGVCGIADGNSASGAGGVGGYTGVGGSGANPMSLAQQRINNDAGAGGGAGTANQTSAVSARGGSTGLFGIQPNAPASAAGTAEATFGRAATGGSFGGGALSRHTGSLGSTFTQAEGQVAFPIGTGGGSCRTNNLSAGGGANGAVRIVWPGDTRQFPSTDVDDNRTFDVITRKTIGTSSVDLATIGVKVGDFVIVCWCYTGSGASPSISPAGPFVYESAAGSTISTTTPDTRVFYGIIRDSSQITTYSLVTTSVSQIEGIVTVYRPKQAFGGVRIQRQGIARNKSTSTATTLISSSQSPLLGPYRGTTILWCNKFGGANGSLAAADYVVKLYGGKSASGPEVMKHFHPAPDVNGQTPSTGVTTISLEVFWKIYEGPITNPGMQSNTTVLNGGCGYIAFGVI